MPGKCCKFHTFQIRSNLYIYIFNNKVAKLAQEHVETSLYCITGFGLLQGQVTEPIGWDPSVATAGVREISIRTASLALGALLSSIFLY